MEKKKICTHRHDTHSFTTDFPEGLNMNSWITLADAVDAICKHFHKGYIDIKQRDTLLAQALGFEHLKSPPEGIVPIAREYIPEARYRSKRRK